MNIRLRGGELNPGRLRDRQKCYQLHHAGFVLATPVGLEPTTF